MVKITGGNPVIVNERNGLISAKKVILPGVGSFDKAVSNLYKMNIVDLLFEKVLNQKIPLLGICLGMQILSKGSEEGEMKGLGFFDGYCKRFNFGDDQSNLKIPHMGWNIVKESRSTSLLSDQTPDTRYYFIHSYHYMSKNQDEVVAETNYGYSFPSVIMKGNIYGTQFHPEKSHRYGKELIHNFIDKI